METCDLGKEHLLEIIELQESLIEGERLEDIVHAHIKMFQNSTRADIIVVCLKAEDMINLRFIIEEKNIFKQLAKKYFPLQKKYRWNTFLDHCHSRYISQGNYMEIKDLHDILKGYLSKKEALEMSAELGMTKGVITPLYTQNKYNRMGFSLFISQSDTPLDFKEIEISTLLLQHILQPLYDKENHMLFAKCVRINEDMGMLTKQEKIIVKKVLAGFTYPEIAAELSISINTLKTHMKNIFNKYGISSKLELYKKLNSSA